MAKKRFLPENKARLEKLRDAFATPSRSTAILSKAH